MKPVSIVKEIESSASNKKALFLDKTGPPTANLNVTVNQTESTIGTTCIPIAIPPNPSTVDSEISKINAPLVGKKENETQISLNLKVEDGEEIVKKKFYRVLKNDGSSIPLDSLPKSIDISPKTSSASQFDTVRRVGLSKKRLVKPLHPGFK